MGAYSGPELVDDGLVLALDAANTRSYGGSGTTWTDVSYRGNNGTLTNGPVFTQEPSLEPFGGAGAVSFDGSGDYLTVAETGSELTFGTGDFTIEFWVYRNNTNETIYFDWRNVGGNQGARPIIYSYNLQLRYFLSGGDTITGTDLSANTWHHVALCRSGTSTKMFVDGTQNGSTYSDSATYLSPQGSEGIYIGAFAGGSYDLNGYISNFRILKGTALYTSNFTPKRQPLIPESAPNTVLLTCQKGNIRDRSSSALAITINGDAKSISGASYFYFDGTNDYVTIGSFPNTTFDFGSGAFTLECWIDISTFAAGASPTYGVNTIYGTGDSDVGSDFRFLILQGSILGGYTTNGVYLTVNSIPIAIGAYSSFTTNTWYHCVATRIGNNIYIFLNGELLSTTSYASSIPNATSYQPSIGAIQYRGSFFYPLNGKISNTRIYKGKGLTASEVLQNYQNTKSLYGL